MPKYLGVRFDLFIFFPSFFEYLETLAALRGRLLFQSWDHRMWYCKIPRSIFSFTSVFQYEIVFDVATVVRLWFFVV